MQIKQEQRQESDATVKKVEDDRALATQVGPYKFTKYITLLAPNKFIFF